MKRLCMYPQGNPSQPECSSSCSQCLEHFEVQTSRPALKTGEPCKLRDSRSSSLQWTGRHPATILSTSQYYKSNNVMQVKYYINIQRLSGRGVDVQSRGSKRRADAVGRISLEWLSAA